MGAHRNSKTNAIKPTMSVYNGIALIATQMIGSGIFITPAIVVADVQSVGMAFILWIVAALISLCGANAFVELGMLFPKSGGSLNYFAYMFRKPKYLLSFIYCLTQILVIWPAAISSELNATSTQLLYNIDKTDKVMYGWYIKIASVVILTVICLINYFSVSFAMKLSTGLTYIKFYTLYALCIAGVFAYCGFSVLPINHNIQLFGGQSSNPSDYASAFFKLLWVFDGWSNLNYAIEEMKDPKRDFPTAVYGGVGITSVLYLITNFFFITIVPFDQILTSSTSIAAVYSEIIFGEFVGGKIVPFLIFLSCYGTTDNMVYTVSRIIHASARSKIIPFYSVFSKLDLKRGSPGPALLYTWIISVVLVLLPLSDDAFTFFLQMAIYPKWIFYSIAVIGLLYLRYSEPELIRPVTAWVICCVAVIIASIFLAIFPLLGSDMVASVVSLAVMVASIFIYFIIRKQVIQADFGFDTMMKRTGDVEERIGSSIEYNDPSTVRKPEETVYSEMNDYSFHDEDGDFYAPSEHHKNEEYHEPHINQ